MGYLSFCLFVCLLIFFFEFSFDYPGINYIDQDDLELRKISLPLPPAHTHYGLPIFSDVQLCQLLPTLVSKVDTPVPLP